MEVLMQVKGGTFLVNFFYFKFLVGEVEVQGVTGKKRKKLAWKENSLSLFSFFCPHTNF